MSYTRLRNRQARKQRTVFAGSKSRRNKAMPGRGLENVGRTGLQDRPETGVRSETTRRLVVRYRCSHECAHLVKMQISRPDELVSDCQSTIARERHASLRRSRKNILPLPQDKHPRLRPFLEQNRAVSSSRPNPASLVFSVCLTNKPFSGDRCLLVSMFLHEEFFTRIVQDAPLLRFLRKVRPVFRT